MTPVDAASALLTAEFVGRRRVGRRGGVFAVALVSLLGLPYVGPVLLAVVPVKLLMRYAEIEA